MDYFTNKEREIIKKMLLDEPGEPEGEPEETEGEPEVKGEPEETEGEPEVKGEPEETEGEPEVKGEPKKPRSFFRDNTIELLDYIKDADNMLNSIKEKYEAGEMDHDEFWEKKDAVLREKTKLEAVIEARQDAMDRQWEKEQSDFYRENPGYAPPQAGQVNPLFEAFAGTVNNLLGDGRIPMNPAIQGMDGQEILEYAKSQVEKVFGGFGLPEQPKQLQPEAALRKAREHLGDKRVPPSTGGVPQAAPQGGSQWGYIDELLMNDPVKAEEAVARMKPDQRNAWLRA